MDHALPRAHFALGVGRIHTLVISGLGSAVAAVAAVCQESGEDRG